jgi:hypothetical protein
MKTLYTVNPAKYICEYSCNKNVAYRETDRISWQIHKKIIPNFHQFYILGEYDQRKIRKMELYLQNEKHILVRKLL